MAGLAASPFAFVLSFLVSLALVLALSASWVALTSFLGSSWWRWFGLILSLTLPLFLLYLLVPTLPIFPLFFGFLAALGTSQLLLYGRSQANFAVSFPWLIIFLFAVIAGLYPHLPTSLLSGLREARIETTGIHLILADQRSRDASLPVFEFDARPLVAARRSPYLSGMQSLLNLIDDAVDDLDRVNTYCNLETFGQLCNDGHLDAMKRFRASAIAYFTAIRPLVQCLAGYADDFPSGLPIQDELSDIAINFAKRDKAASNGEISAAQIEHDLPRTFASIVATVADTSLKPVGTNSTVISCKDLLAESLNYYYAEFLKSPEMGILPGLQEAPAPVCEAVSGLSSPDQKLGCRVWQLITNVRREWRRHWGEVGAKPPYLSLVETYIITAAGYPQDAAYYIQDEFYVPQKQDYKSFGQLAHWIFSFRMLHAMERMLEEAEDFNKQAVALGELSEEYKEFFRTLFETDDMWDLLQYCDARWEKSDFWSKVAQESKGSGVAEDLQYFLSRTLFFHIRSELRRWATRDRSEELTDTLREAGDRLERIFADEEGFFEGCFDGWMHSLPDESAEEKNIKRDVRNQIDMVHAELGLTSGAIKLAELLSEMGNGGEEGGLTRQGKSAVLCDARNIFNRVKDGLPRSGGKAGSWEETAWLRASKFNAAIDASEPQCEFDGNG
jgi:hypothetical protein